VIETHREKTLLLLVRKIDQFAELFDQPLSGRIVALGRLDGKLVFAIVESHELHEAACGVGRVPIGANLFVRFKMITAQARERLTKPLDQPGVLGALIFRDDVAVGLEEHSQLSNGAVAAIVPYQSRRFKLHYGSEKGETGDQATSTLIRLSIASPSV
jgi:hypothetical protein